MPINLSANEARVLGCLMEKSVVTPDQYPLTLNGLTNACNQKSSRNPVMSLEQGVVQHTARVLQDKHVVSVEENFKNGVEKYKHVFCNTQFGEYQFDTAQFAIVCLLLLRGPQTPGELRARSGRLHAFADNAEVVASLDGLMEREGESLVVKLPRTLGRKDSEYMHLFSGPIDVEAYAAQAPSKGDGGHLNQTGNHTGDQTSVSELEQRVSKLEAEVAELKAQLKISS